MTTGKILYITDKFGVSQGYEPAFTRMLNRVGLQRGQIVTTDIYRLVSSPLKKYGNETTWKFDVDKTKEIEEAFLNRVNIIKPKLIVISDPACVGLFAKWDLKVATLDKMRGGVYWMGETPVIITLPITAIHRNLDSRLVKNDDGEEDTQEPYQVQKGNWILAQDWMKVSRFYHGKQRRLPPFRYSVVRSLEDAVHARTFLDSCILIATDIETGCWPPTQTCIGFTGLTADGRCHSYVFPYYNEYAPGGTFWDSELDHAAIWECVASILNNPIPKTMQNGNYDASYFIRDRQPIRNWNLDSMLMWYALYPELPKTLDFISSCLLDNFQYWKDDIKGKEDESTKTGMEQYWRYNALDCYYTLWNTVYLTLLASKNQPMQVNYNDVFMRALSGLKMGMRGMKADFNRREEHRAQLTAERMDALDKLRYMIDDPDFNVESPAQKVALLYDFLGIRPRNDRGRFVARDGKGKGKAPSAGALALKLAKTDHPFFRIIIEAMEAAMTPQKQISNVCDVKLYTDRMRYAMNAAGTETGRFSTKSSNFWDGSTIQNIRKEYRDWMVADDGCVLLDVDYSQSDDVFMAYESQDPEKIKVVESGLDAHAVNGELFFKWEYDRIVAGKKANDPLVVHPLTGVRQLSKRIVHGTNFQMAAMTLYVTMGREAVVAAAELLGYNDAESWPQERLVQFCGVLMATYRKRYRRLTPKEYYAEIAGILKSDGVIFNAFGISRRFLGNPSDNGTQREATAYIGQSDTSGNMNRTMYEIDFGYIPKTFRDGPNPDANEKPLMMSHESHGFRFLLQVHDNFLSQLDTRHPRWKEAACNVLTVMNRPVIIHGREVRVKAEADVGLRWGKGMLGWGGDPHDLDRIVTSLKTEKGLGQWLAVTTA